MNAGAEFSLSKDLKDIAKRLDALLAKSAGERMGFALVVFPFGRLGRGSYVSNCERDKMVEELETLLQRWKDGMPDVPAHEVN